MTSAWNVLLGAGNYVDALAAYATVAFSPEKVSNGDFASGTTGWSAANSASLSVGSGQLTITEAGGTNPGASQTLTGLVVGWTYTLTCSYVSGTAATFRLGIDTTSPTTADYVTSGGAATAAMTFVATATSHALTLTAVCASASGQTAVVDNASVKVGRWLSTLPLANLRSPLLRRVARSFDAASASTQFMIDLGVNRSINAMGIFAHNISASGRWRFKLATDAAFTNIVLQTSWTEVWPVAYPEGTLAFEDEHWLTGKPAAEELGGDYPPALYLSAEAQIYAGRYLLIEIDDTANPDGYVDLGRLFVCNAHQFSINMAYGAGFSFESPVQELESLGGTIFFDDDPSDERPIVRTRVAFSFDALPDDEAVTWVHDINKRAGISRQVLFSWDPTDTAHRHRRTFLGTITEMGTLEAVTCGIHSSAFEIRQVL